MSKRAIWLAEGIIGAVAVIAALAEQWQTAAGMAALIAATLDKLRE